jgi:hypothetical protein
LGVDWVEDIKSAYFLALMHLPGQVVYAFSFDLYFCHNGSTCNSFLFLFHTNQIKKDKQHPTLLSSAKRVSLNFTFFSPFNERLQAASDYP